MEYSVCELARLSGVTARTLRWYDRIGLLKPSRVGGNGYRYYSESEVNRLQHILYYRALGLELRRIAELLDDPAFDRLSALRGHLEMLEQERRRVDALIASVRRCIQAEERNETMSDHEKFEAFKREAVAQNERQYGAEIREKYTDAEIDRANRRMMDMTPAQYDEWKALEAEILRRLESAVRSGADPAGAEGRAIAALHLRWVRFSWAGCTPQHQIGLASMYVQDERFLAYYDRETSGCADFLLRAVLAANGRA